MSDADSGVVHMFESGKTEGMLEALEVVSRVGASLVSSSATHAELEQAKGANLAAEVLTAHLKKRMKNRL